jgi:hypothetical protein
MADNKNTEATWYDRVVAMAEELEFPTPEKKAQYIDDHMKQKNWTPTTTWSPPDGKDGKKSGDGGGSSWFS